MDVCLLYMINMPDDADTDGRTDREECSQGEMDNDTERK